MERFTVYSQQSTILLNYSLWTMDCSTAAANCGLIANLKFRDGDGGLISGRGIQDGDTDPIGSLKDFNLEEPHF